MSRNIRITKGYIITNQSQKGRSIYIDGYLREYGDGTISNKNADFIKTVLPPEFDIFSTLPVTRFNNEHVEIFLNEMKKALLAWGKEELDRIVLPKLQLTEFTDVTIVIEWIFNYFRLYFMFDKNEGDYYGEVMNDIQNGNFHNESRKMDVSDFSEIAEAEVDYAVMMAEGRK